jgi:hypothetical protein
MTTATRLTGDSLLAKIAELDCTLTATQRVIACGYQRDNGKCDYVDFYTALIEAKGLNVPTEDPEMDDTEADLRERFSDEAVDAFIEVWSVDDLENFEDAYQGEYESGAKFAQELVEGCYGLLDIPSFVSIDWADTWENLRYDYCEEDGFIFSTNW